MGRSDSGPRVSPPGLTATLATARWAFHITWETQPLHLLTVIGVALARSTVAAGLALAARGLLNAAVAEIKSGQGRVEPLVPWLLMGLGFALVEVLTPLLGNYVQRRLGQALELRLTTQILTHASTLGPAQVEGAERRTLLERAREGASHRLTRLVMDLIVVATELIQAVLLAGVLLHVEPLVLVLVVPAAVLYFIAEWRATSYHEAEAPTRALKRRWVSYFSGLLTGERSLHEIRLLGLAATLVERFRALTAQLDADENTRARGHLATSAAFGVVTTGIFYACLALVASRAVTGRLTVGDVAVFVAVGSRLRFTLSRLVGGITHVLEAGLAAEAVRTFLAIEPSHPAIGHPGPALSSPGIEVEDVWFTYPGADEPTLSGVSLSIQPGEIVALAGPNGAGKTTLIKLLAGLYVPDRGRILVYGRDLREWPFEAHRERLAVVSQESLRFEATARDNIAFGHWATLSGASGAVERAAARAGVEGLLGGLPRGYQTSLGRLFGEHDLSSGQWQQIILARAQARPASLWLLDEPSTHMDERAEQQLIERLQDLARGRAILLVSHRPALLAAADRIVVLERGRVAEAGIEPDSLPQPRRG